MEDKRKLYRLVEVEFSGSPATVEPGRYVIAGDDGVDFGMEVDRPMELRAIGEHMAAIAGQMENPMPVHRSHWFRPELEGAK
jgi:hypothetical protein